MDKKISELTMVQSIDPADVSILVRNNNDYQFNFDTLLTYISSNIPIGAAISFGTTLPQNNTGKNGDVFVNTAANNFAQKIAGTWTIVYTLPSGQQADGTSLYGLGSPNSTTGKNGDTYIDTGSGIFYKKTSGSWNVVFTMLNGPAGVKGDKGDTGPTGTNGKTILNGNINPSNQNTGTNGDFYINTSTLTLFGPKTGGTWPGGLSLVPVSELAFSKAYNYNISDPRFNIDADLNLTFSLNTEDQLLFPYDPDKVLKATLRQKISNTQYRQKNSFEAIITTDGSNNVSIAFEGITDDLTTIQIILS